jgi:hypothetical protein
VRLLLACVAFLCCACAHADTPTWFKEGRIGAGLDVIHESGMPMASLSLYPVSVYAWSHNFGVGATFEMGKRVGWNAGVGGIVVRHVDDDLGTNLNFLLRASYCGQKVCLSFAHISHGGVIGIREDANNYGLNFLYLEYRYK